MILSAYKDGLNITVDYDPEERTIIEVIRISFVTKDNRFIDITDAMISFELTDKISDSIEDWHEIYYYQQNQIL